MERYKEKLKLQIIVTAISCAVLAVFAVVTFDPEAGVTVGSGLTNWRAFSSGAACGVLAVRIFELVRSILAMKDEKKLKQLYVEDRDERNNQIYLSARTAAMQTFLSLGLVAGIIAGYFNLTVGLTVIACVVAASLLCLGFKLYYGRKF